jgi:hypothetical protein
MYWELLDYGGIKMKIVKIDNLIINLEELCYFEVSDAIIMKDIPQQKIEFYFKNGKNISTKYKPESIIECIVEKIGNIMQG